MLTPQVYRQKIEATRKHIQSVIDALDDDQIECEDSHGTLTLIVNQKYWIISTQPPLQQLWLAVASKGTAYRFSYHSETQSWRDEKDSANELLALLRKIIQDETGITVEF